MRYRELLSEASYKPKKLVGYAVNDTSTQKNAIKVAQYILDNCKPWLNQAGNNVVYRGSSSIQNAPAFLKNTRPNRQPKDTDELRHNIFNSFIAAAGGIANRTNSIFVTGDVNIASDYGLPYAFFPIGDFHYTWSPIYMDWTSDIEFPDEIENFLKPMNKILAIPEILAVYKDHIEYLKKYLNLQKNKPKDPKAFNKEVMSLLQREVADSGYRREVFLTPAAYDMKYLSKAIIHDRGLVKAIRAEHEIMIQCAQGLYVDYEYYLYEVSPILKQSLSKKKI